MGAGAANYCYICFGNAAHAKAAIADLNGFRFEGRDLRVGLSNYQGVNVNLRAVDDEAVSAAASSVSGGAATANEAEEWNQIPTEFTSRDAKQAARQELRQELRHEAAPACTVCSEVGHFAQGCPLMMGVGRAASNRWAPKLTDQE